MSHPDTQRPKDDRVRKSPEAMASGGPANNDGVPDGRRSSATSPALGGVVGQQQPLNLPVTTNRPPSRTNRPPSATSNHSNNSNNTPRPTTTSRRGGRARSRSPVANVGRGPGDYMGDSFAPQGSPPQIANPSSAAAAAAAAAKAFSNRRPNAWYDDVHGGAGQRPPLRRGVIDNPRYRPQAGFELSGGRGWHGEENPDQRRAYMQDGFQRGPPPPGQFDRFDDRGDFNNARFGGPHGRRPFDQEGGRPGGPRPTGRLTPPVPPGQFGPEGHARPAELFQGGMTPITDGLDDKPGDNQRLFASDKPNESTTPKGDSQNNMKHARGSTSRVIGTPTPIHVPRAGDGPKNASAARQRGTPASVFRGRPGGDVGGPPGAMDEDDESPQKILLSLRTPTTSFEERDGQKATKGATGGGAQPLSPEDPPKIQHAHNQNQVDSNIFFEPQRSPKQQGGTIEMAPSFSLFNQSFDSLGDSPAYLNVGAPLDAAFRSNSFGNGPSASNDLEGGPQLLPNPSLQRNTSSVGGSFGAPYPPSQNLLSGGSSGGMLTFGMSPDNSFGQGPAQGRQGNNMMVLGGNDARSASPTQMLSMYPSYSGGFGGNLSGLNQSPPFRNGSNMGDSHMRSLSSGSFGGAPLLHTYTPRSFGADGSPLVNYHALHSPARGAEGFPGPTVFYAFLRRHKGAFIRCSFLLPGLKAALLETPIPEIQKPEAGKKSKKKGKRTPSLPLSMVPRHGTGSDPRAGDIAVALRRVVCAVCAFGGGTPNMERMLKPQAVSLEGRQSIFREKDTDADQLSPTTVTPSSTMTTPPGNRGIARSKATYDELLAVRYYENDSRLSWEFEENPPVGNLSDDENERPNKRRNSTGSDDKSASKRLKTEGDEASKDGSSVTGGKQAPSSEGGKKSKEDQPKMRYRCKLCGQPKQNHTCPYQQSLQRSIGVTVYPAVNAFHASEPGVLAPPLEDMNNFVLGGEGSENGSPSRPTPDRKRQTVEVATTSQVTPDTLRSGTTGSPGSSLSTGTSTPVGTPFRTPKSKRDLGGQLAEAGRKGGSLNRRGTLTMTNRPRHRLGGTEKSELLFAEPMELKQEQFRIVNASKPLPDAYTYPALPLPYAQRKRLSDNLFALSKEVPQLTDECAVVLREARERDLWDLAVAELMTQVVVIMHCRDGDSTFEGLRRYLLSLGIAC